LNPLGKIAVSENVLKDDLIPRFQSSPPVVIGYEAHFIDDFLSGEISAAITIIITIIIAIIITITT
jgi:hypothetical protein